MNSIYKNPIQPNIPNPVNLDAILQDLQQELNNLSWLSYSFGRARIAEELREGSSFIYPEVYKNDGSYRYIPMLPSRDYNNFCFFLVNDPIEFIKGYRTLTKVLINQQIPSNTLQILEPQTQR